MLELEGDTLLSAQTNPAPPAQPEHTTGMASGPSSGLHSTSGDTTTTATHSTRKGDHSIADDDVDEDEDGQQQQEQEQEEPDVVFTSMGYHKLKGIQGQVQLFYCRWVGCDVGRIDVTWCDTNMWVGCDVMRRKYRFMMPSMTT